MNPAGEDVRPRRRQRVAVGGRSRCGGRRRREDGVDVEPEAEREHRGDGSAAAGVVNRTTGPACYCAGEEGVGRARRSRAGSRARPSAPRRSWRAWTASSRRSARARPVLSATWPAVIASPPASAASTEALVAPGAVRRAERVAGWLVRRAGARFAADALAWAPWPARLRAESCARGACAPAPEERGSSAASALRSRSASPASWSRRSWICSRRRSITFHFLAVGGGRSYPAG